MLDSVPPKQLKQAEASCGQVVLLEHESSPRYAIEAWRVDGAFTLYATDDPETAEAVYVRASLLL